MCSPGNKMEAYQVVPPICESVADLPSKTNNESGIDQKSATSNTFKCPDCDYEGKKKALYWAHRKNVHREPGCFKCPICEKVFGSKKNMKGHLARHSTTGSFLCDVCGNKYTDKKTLEKHTDRFNGECVRKPQSQPLCETVHVSPTNESGINQKADTVIIFKCPDCDYVGKKKVLYWAHRRNVHREPGCFKCPVCEKIFGSKKNMKGHLARHSTTGIFPCNECGVIYNDKKTLVRHEKKHKEGWVEKPFPCNQCSKKFSSTSGLKFHMESEHLGLEGDFLCYICGKRFRHSSGYNEHMNAHLNIKPFVCEICGKASSYRVGLREHKCTSSEKKTFVCTVCSKVFHHRSSLVIHKRIHKTTKDYHCRFCGKEFTTKNSVLRHERIHNGEKPSVCGVCDKRFSDASVIRRHMILVHKQDPKHWKANTYEEKRNKELTFFETQSSHASGCKS